MTNYITVPGLGSSGPDHWQTWFEAAGSSFSRVQQKNWDAPICAEWVQTLDHCITGFDLSTVVLIGHSLGCITIAHWAQQHKKCIKGALLVAPADIEFPPFPVPISGFAPIPLDRLPFRTTVVASSNDQWGKLERVSYFAERWGSEIITIGDAGHINAASGHNEWKEGLALLKRLG